MVYFVQAVDGGPVKIGYSANVAARIKQLQSHFGKKLAILATIEGNRRTEQAIHERFAEHRLGETEQFRPVAEIMAFIGRPLLVGVDPDTIEAMPVLSEATKPRQFRFTDDEIAEIDALGRTLAQPGVPVTRMTVLRLALQEFKAKRMKGVGR